MKDKIYHLTCDVGQNLSFNLLILGFLCNFCYFIFRVIISLFLNVFNVVQSNQSFEDFPNYLRFSSMQHPMAIEIIINNNSYFVSIYYQKLTVQLMFYHKEYCAFVLSSSFCEIKMPSTSGKEIKAQLLESQIVGPLSLLCLWLIKEIFWILHKWEGD